MKRLHRSMCWALLAGSLLTLLLTIYSGNFAWGTLAISVAALGSAALVRDHQQKRSPKAEPALEISDEETPQPSPAKSSDQNDLGMLIEEMLAHGRYALLLRPQIIGNLSANQLDRTRRALSDAMAIVPAGEVLLGNGEPLLDDGRFTDDDLSRDRLGRVSVEDFFLDRYPVTNRQYHHFVASGGYEQMSLWDPAILAALLDFVDQTGCPGPRCWVDGKYPRGEEDFPVVGVSWYEATAFARWVGKRLPTDAEWVKAASWPVPVAPGVWQQRKFPWGNSMDRSRANLWSTGLGHLAPVDRYAEGVSPGGVHQLVGNVWEWTTGDFGYDDLEGPLLSEPSGAAVMKNLRGGAFDTYFESQATCQFRSGDHPLARKHNIGFRCALGACDVGSIRDDDSQELHDTVADDESSVHSSSLQLQEAGV